MDNLIVTVGLYISYIMIILGVVLAIVFPFINLLSQPKQLIRAGIGILVILVVFGLGYALASGEVTAKFIESDVTTGGLSRTIGGAIKMVYILTLVLIAGIFYTEFNKIFK